jgi:GH24 family phage-related lysozyme (muramidase)
MPILDEPRMSDFIRRLGEFEGKIPHLYRDAGTGGHVTVGVGHLVPSAIHAEQLKWEGGMGAPGVAAREYDAVMSAQPGMIASAYAGLTTLRLSDEAIDELLAQDVKVKEPELLNAVPDVMGFPAPARQALMDFAFNVGASRLAAPAPRGWPSMMSAIRAKDWEKAAAESHRNGIQAERNMYAAHLLLSCGGS